MCLVVKLNFDAINNNCIGTWNVRSMNQGKLDMIKQEMAKVNINILGISELKLIGMGEFNSDDHYIYYCGQESLRRNAVALTVTSTTGHRFCFGSIPSIFSGVISSLISRKNEETEPKQKQHPVVDVTGSGSKV